ncbi:MAG: hypothetical protein QXS50_02530 [Candidatus Caldarchaeum sp.]
MAKLVLNPGAQAEFVTNPYRASAFIGGLGAGKTFALLARGLTLSQQPKRGFWGPRGCVAAINYPVLKDVVLPLFFEMVDGTGLLLDYIRSEKKALLVPYDDNGVPNRKLVKKNGEGAVEILFRSLDQPNWMRGLELSWFGIDEGRHVNGEAWDILYGRLRQRGYLHRGFVCSTPNGFDWMWQKFHPDSPNRLADSRWYGAPTFDNRRNLPPEYIDSLLATYQGRFLRQEVYGEFVGTVEGAVFFEYDPSRHSGKNIRYNPKLPLYSFWDFGMGDLGVVVFAQVEWVKWKPEGASQEVLVPKLYILDALEATDRTSAEWVKVFERHVREVYGITPDDVELNICDPAGRQRSISTGRSVVQDLYAYGLTVVPAPKKPIDYAIRILNNMLASDRVLISSRAERVAAAMASHKWNIDSSGVRVGTTPVHDWTSHFCDAIRYGVAMLLTHEAKRTPPKRKETFSPDQWGYIEQQLLRDYDPDPWGLGDPDGGEDIHWEPSVLGL